MTDISPEAVEYLAEKADQCELSYDDPVASTLRALSAENAELRAKLVEAQCNLIDLDEWVNNAMKEIHGDFTQEELAASAEDISRDWYGGGVGASFRQAILALTTGDTPNG